MLLESLRARVISRGARNYRAYAELAAGYEERIWTSNGTAQPRDPDARRPGGRDHALERAVHALDLEDGAGARRRLHGGPEAGRVVAALLLAARRPDRRGRPAAGRLQRRPGDRRARRRGAHLEPRRRPDLVHRLAGDGARDRPRRGLEPGPVHRRARRQGPAAGLRRRRPRRRRGARRRGCTTTPARSASPAPGCSSSARWSTSSWSGSAPRSTRRCSATRAIPRRRSRR